MIRLVLALALLAAALPAAAAPAAARAQKRTPTKPARAEPEHGKARAPVEVTARLADGTATVTVRFLAAGSGVEIQAWGADGLTVTRATVPVAGGRFDAGQETTFDVSFAPGPGRSHLAVAVAGQFAGGHRSTVSTFAVGELTEAQAKARPAAATEGGGQRLKVLPAGQ